VVELGGGLFAFYAHMQKGSLTVARGDQVKRGEILGKLGNTGSSWCIFISWMVPRFWGRAACLM
jgi:hypothetical protein